MDGSVDGGLEQIWQLLLEACRRERPYGQEAWHTSLCGGAFDLHPSGAWRAEAELGDGARNLLDALAPLVAGPGIVIAQLGQSLDGRIATRTGHSHYINGAPALTHLHRLRALVDAVVVGAGTACADVPQLTVRHVEGDDPVRVMLDPNGRVPSRGALFEGTDSPAPVLHLIGPDARPEPADRHVERIRLELRDGGFAPADILTALQARGLHRVLIEGGADTVSRFMHAGALDRLHLLVAPLIIGSGRNGLELPPIDQLDQAQRPPIRSYRLEDELLIDVDLRTRGRQGSHGAMIKPTGDQP